MSYFPTDNQVTLNETVLNQILNQFPARKTKRLQTSFRGFLTTTKPDRDSITAYREFEDGTTFICKGGQAVFVPK